MKLFRFYFTIILFFLSINLSSPCLAIEKVFYVLHHKPNSEISSSSKSLSIINEHAKSIHILISQAYHIDQNGGVTGFIDQDILNLVHKKTNKIKLMAMITNANFDKENSHAFLTNKHAQEIAIKSIIDLCHQEHLYGVQFDFEMIPLTDKDALTKFYQNAAAQLHQQGFIVSFAVAPIVTEGPFPSAFQKRIYEVWAGAYDIKLLGKSADFLTIMAYNQHVGKMIPGPTADIRWVEQTIKYALQYIPTKKISLGIPVYSGFWYMGTNSSTSLGKVSIQHNEISYDTLQTLVEKNQVKLKWDEMGKFNYGFYEKNWAYEYLFVENAKSFKEKMKLAKKYHLRGISVFRVAAEDPKIWRIL